jgi:hypothetical protein
VGPKAHSQALGVGEGIAEGPGTGDRDKGGSQPARRPEAAETGVWRSSDAESVTAARAEKRFGRSLRTERVQHSVLPVLGDDRAFSLRLLTTIAPVDPDHSPLIAQPSDHRIVATVGHHTANWPSNSAHERPTSASPPRRIEDDNRVRPLQAKIERFVIVAVGDPGVAREQGALLHPPLVVRRLHPSWLPIVEVEMDQR